MNSDRDAVTRIFEWMTVTGFVTGVLAALTLGFMGIAPFATNFDDRIGEIVCERAACFTPTPEAD